MTIKRVAIVFSGGPAPGANAVISAAAIPFVERGTDVIGIFHGYTHLAAFDGTQPLMPNKHYRKLEARDVFGMRNEPGVMIGTARVNPGIGVNTEDDLKDEEKTRQLSNVCRALASLNVDALISIGGDGTLMTANFLVQYQKLFPERKSIRIVHLPKTIDNDYHGIDFAFGFFSAVDTIAKNLLNVRADAHATGSYFIAQTMGRQAGWLAYGAATAGEADYVIGVEDVKGFSDSKGNFSLTVAARKLVDIMEAREEAGDHFGVFVVAEGLAGKLPPSNTEQAQRDQHGRLQFGQFGIASMLAEEVNAEYRSRKGVSKRIKAVRFGYEARSVAPHAFDVMLGSQLGVGAFRALVEENLDAHMVSVSGQLDLEYIPFTELVEENSFFVPVRFVPEKSDFRKLVRFLEAHTNSGREWDLGRRSEDFGSPSFPTS